MPAIITDLATDFLTLWQSANREPMERQRARWFAEYLHAHRGVFAASDGRHGEPDALDAALARYPADIDRIRSMVPIVRAAIDRNSAGIEALLGAKLGSSRWFTLVGMYWSDAWVSILDDEPAGFVALEMTAEPPLLDVLIAHEATHLCHGLFAPFVFSESPKLGHMLFVEGLAVAATAQTLPGIPLGRHLWPGRTTTAEGQPVEHWLDRCVDAWPEIRASVARDLNRDDPRTMSDYFTGRSALDTIPVRAGYFAGFRLIQEIAMERSLAEMARWPADRAIEEVARHLR